MSAQECSTIRAAAIQILSISVPDGKAQADIEYRTVLLDHCLELQIPIQVLTLNEAEAFAVVYHECSNYDVAELLLKHAWDLCQATANHEPVQLIRIGLALGLTYIFSGQHDTAESFLPHLTEVATSILSPDHPQTLRARFLLGFCLHYATHYT
jgi:hypothetical protein